MCVSLSEYAAVWNLKPDLDQEADVRTNSRDTIYQVNKPGMTSRQPIVWRPYIATASRVAYSIITGT